MIVSCYHLKMSFQKSKNVNQTEIPYHNTVSLPCPVCNREFEENVIEEHVNKCLFLNTVSEKKTKRDNSHLTETFITGKKLKVDVASNSSPKSNQEIKKESKMLNTENSETPKFRIGIPLAEQMRPHELDDLVGQTDAFGPNSMLRSILEQKKVPNMILWGPPGCGKTSIANVIAHICKESNNLRFVKLSATMAGVNDIKEVVKVAKNEVQFKRQTVLFMDEIHRFNKLQQDSFLAHVENGTIILIGATTENPSFSLNNALLSRCRVVVMSKLTVEDILQILKRTLVRNKLATIVDNVEDITTKEKDGRPQDAAIIENSSLQWLAEVCDGDARIALGSLELALTAAKAQLETSSSNSSPIITLSNLKDGIKRSHVLYDRNGEEHYNLISAIHKSIRASDDNAALYWTTRALHSGEDPLYIARRLIRIACEDVGLGDQNAIVEAVACLHGCQHVGMPECDVLLVQCAVSLARAPKSREVYDAMKKCQAFLKEAKGPLPSVPLHLRNAPTKLMKQMGFFLRDKVTRRASRAPAHNTVPRVCLALCYDRHPETLESLSLSPVFYWRHCPSNQNTVVVAHYCLAAEYLVMQWYHPSRTRQESYHLLNIQNNTGRYKKTITDLLGYAKGYNLLQKDESGLDYMPDGMNNVNFFKNN